MNLFILLIAALLPAALAGRPRIALEGQPEYLHPNEKLDIPPYIRKFSDETFIKELKANDVAVMYMREQHCPDCDFYAKYFYNSTREVADLPGVIIGEMDIHDEGDLFEEWHGTEEDIPAIFIFKSHDTVKYRKRPVQFVVNTRIEYDLAPFIKRMRGPAAKTVSTVSEFEDHLQQASNYSDGLMVAMWKPPGLKKKASKMTDMLLQRLAELERYNLLFVLIDGDSTEDFIALSEKYNPVHVPDPEGRTPVIVTYETAYQPPQTAFYGISIDANFREEIHSIREWVEKEKPKRRGHKYDRMVTYFQEDLIVPSNYSTSRKVEGKDYVVGYAEGRSAATQVLVMRRRLEFVTGENKMMKGIERGIVGMSAGMKRMLVLPHEWWEGWPFDPIDLHNQTSLLVELSVNVVDDSHKMPGRIEWETDPEKIAEHKRKVEQREKERQEMIARGEDPDAQCKAQKPENADESDTVQKGSSKKKKTKKA